MGRKKKRIYQPRANKQGSINIAAELHDKVKDYCEAHDMTQVEFVKYALKIMESLQGHPRHYTGDAIPNPVYRAVKNIEDAVKDVGELKVAVMDLGRSNFQLTKRLEEHLKTVEGSVEGSTEKDSVSIVEESTGTNTVPKAENTPSHTPEEKDPAEPSEPDNIIIEFDNRELLTADEQKVFIKHKICPSCREKRLVYKGKNGERFIGCLNYPVCGFKAEGTFEAPIIKPMFVGGVRKIKLKKSDKE